MLVSAPLIELVSAEFGSVEAGSITLRQRTIAPELRVGIQILAADEIAYEIACTAGL